MTQATVRKMRLYGALCVSLIMLVLATASARVDQPEPGQPYTAYDVMILARDIGIIALIAGIFVWGMVRVVSSSGKTVTQLTTALDHSADLNNKAAIALARSIDQMKDAVTASNLCHATEMSNLIGTIRAHPCLAEEVIRESIKQRIADAAREPTV